MLPDPGIQEPLHELRASHAQRQLLGRAVGAGLVVVVPRARVGFSVAHRSADERRKAQSEESQGGEFSHRRLERYRSEEKLTQDNDRSNHGRELQR